MDRSRHTRDRKRTPGRPSRRLLENWADERLVELVLAGDEMAFEELFERHAADALWFAREALGSWSAAEEAVRHSFAAAHAYLASRAPNVEFAPWLHTILANHCLSMVQARAPGPGERRDATVVDLAAWRRKRRKLFAALPFAPGFATIGAPAATVGTPLLGGTIAKVVVVAALAAGAGVAGDVATRGGEPSGGGARVVAESGPSPVPAAALDSDPAPDPVPGADGPARQIVEHPSPVRDGAPAADAPAADAPAADAPAPPPVADGVRAPGAAPSAGSGPETVAPPARSALDAVRELVRATDGSDPSPAPPAPVPVDLRRIGHALGVSSAQPPPAVGELLSRVVRGRPR